MLAAVAIVPGSPALVPAVAGAAVPELDAPRAAALQVGARLAAVAPLRWIAVCTADVHDPITVGETGVRHGDLPVDGTYVGYGVDVRVRLRPGAVPESVSDLMPTTVLTAAWLRSETAPGTAVDPVLVDPALDGPRLTAAVDLVGGLIAGDDPVGLLVVADGSTGLTPRAPAGLLDGADRMQARLDTAIAAGDLDAVDALDPDDCARARIDGRAAMQVAATIWRGAGRGAPVAESLWCAAPFGVGGHVAWWRPGSDASGG